VNRASLSYGLTACLPHAGQTVGIERGLVYATDMYTTGLARVAGESVYAALPLGEARDLAKFVKPLRKAQEVEEVQMLVDNDELHVGVGDDSAVFALASEYVHVGLDLLLRSLEVLYGLPDDRRELILNPSFAARFARAARDGDRLRLYPRLSVIPRTRGVALVSVGDAFVGAVAGLAHDDAPPVFESFLQTARNQDVAA
jgi:hypothetical protein